MSREVISQLEKIKIHTLGELLQVDMSDLYNATTHGIYSSYRYIRNTVMNMGLLFEEDHLRFENAEVSDEIALIPIKNLNLPSRLKNIISKEDVVFLGDLLTTDSKRIMRFRGMGEEKFLELKKYVHSLGFPLQNEEPTLLEIKKDFESKGIPMLKESLELDERTSNALYKNRIYTLDDLIDFGQNVFDIMGMKGLSGKKLEAALSARNIQLGTKVEIPKENPDEFQPTPLTVKQLTEENMTIKARIARKQQLLSEYETLLKEREKLYEMERNLDEQIAEKLSLLHSKPEKEDGANYGRR